MPTLYCLGDSLTLGSDFDRQRVWPSLLAHGLRVTAVNGGIGGDTTGGMLARFSAEVAPARPDIVILLGGTNDLWWNLDLRTIQANLFAMACQAQHHGIAPVMATPLPMCMENLLKTQVLEPVEGYARFRGQLDRLSEILAKAARDSELPLIDFYHPSCDAAGKARAELFLEDGLHPNLRGHKLMAETAARVMGEAFGF